MSKVKITLIKSVIDRTKKQKDTIIALGIKKINHSVIKDRNQQIDGMIAKVKHLVKIEEV